MLSWVKATANTSIQVWALAPGSGASSLSAPQGWAGSPELPVQLRELTLHPHLTSHCQPATQPAEARTAGLRSADLTVSTHNRHTMSEVHRPSADIQRSIRRAQALLAHDNLLSPTSRALLFTTQPAPGPDMSLGWFAGRLVDEPRYAHVSGGAGYYSEVRIYPRLDRASFVMFNRTGIRNQLVLDRLDRFLVAANR